MTQCIQRTQTEFGIWEETAWEPEQLRPPGRASARLAVEHCRLTWRPSPELVGQVLGDLGIEFGKREREVVDPATARVAARDLERHARRLAVGHQAEVARDVGVSSLSDLRWRWRIQTERQTA